MLLDNGQQLSSAAPLYPPIGQDALLDPHPPGDQQRVEQAEPHDDADLAEGERQDGDLRRRQPMVGMPNLASLTIAGQ